MQPYSTYLFDADGTLIDTAELIYHCFVHSVGRFGGRTIGRDEVYRHIGLTLRAQLETYLGPLSDERYQEVRDVHMGYQRSVYPQYLRAFPGVADVLAALGEAGCTCGVVSSRMPDTLSLYLDATGLLPYFSVLISPVDTVEHKPHPAPVLEALRRLGVSADGAVYVGDASYDVECGAAAGVDTVLVGWGHSDPAALETKPTWVIQEPQELCEHVYRA